MTLDTSDTALPRVDLLSDVERELLALVGEGLTSKQIAQTRRISVHVIDKHLDSARVKLKADTRRGAARILRARTGELGPQTTSEPRSVGEAAGVGAAPPAVLRPDFLKRFGREGGEALSPIERAAAGVVVALVSMGALCAVLLVAFLTMQLMRAL